MQRKIKIRDESRTPTLEGEEVPSKNDLERVLFASTSNSRTCASIAIIALSDCRLEVQGNRNVNYGSGIEDLPDLKVVFEDGRVRNNLRTNSSHGCRKSFSFKGKKAVLQHGVTTRNALTPSRAKEEFG